MPADWVTDLNRSNVAFLREVWPQIQKQCGGGEIKPVEIFDDVMSRELDMMCGIDIWQTITGEGCRGIGSRVQFGDKNWRTFTIRKERDSGAVTEYEKRKEAIDSGGRFIYPYLTSHAYVSDAGDLLGCGVAITKNIFQAIEAGKAQIRRCENATFFAVKFEDVPGVYEIDLPPF